MSSKNRLTPRVFAEAEKIADIALTPDERELVAKSFPAYRRGFRSARKAALQPHEAPHELPCLRPDESQGSRQHGQESELARRASTPARSKRRRLPSDEDDVAFASLTDLGSWLRSGELTSERLTGLYLERLERHDARLRCVVTLTAERALASARRADSELRAGRDRGPLHGIPWGAKDLLDTAGVPTTWGAEPHRDRVPRRDAEVVRRLDAAGAVLVAKLSLGELAMGDLWFGGRTRNPWNVRQGSSGSSAGSASAVAAGLVGFAIGSETMGSIVSPAFRCGVSGLRPSFGRVPRTGAMPLAWSLDKLGPMARTVRDTALVLEAIHGPDGADVTAVDEPFSFDFGARQGAGGRRVKRRGVRGMTVGHVRADFRGKKAAPADRAALRTLRELGVVVKPIRPKLDLEPLAPILFVEAAAAFDELTRSGADDLLRAQGKDAWPNLFRTARFVPAVEYVQASRLRGRVAREMERVMSGLDAIVTPGTWNSIVAATNYTGHPVVTARCGMHDGRPRQVAIASHPFREDIALALGIVLEKRSGAVGARPEL